MDQYSKKKKKKKKLCTTFRKFCKCFPSAGTKLIGQPWFDKTNNNIKVFKDTDGDGTGDFWVILNPTIS